MYRCKWAKKDIEINYHDNEWCKPSYDDLYIFEMLILETFQAGLSWLIVLNKRESIRNAFSSFDYEKIAKYDEYKIEELLLNEQIIRNKLKIRSAISNAKSYIKIREEFGSFSSYIWKFVNNKICVNYPKDEKQIQSKNDLSDEISKDLKKRGFKFVGSTTVYSFLQSIGIIDDHVINCKEKYGK
ncbi:DNA-3-methyladenine glycosylase I [Caviibacter abscessus]|uniref:DNA-3-methyladenine glycosylase I n=1 Tax=Caviibacter abscessus TaxID=1766719 RepID=UPI00082B6240|nr:DNA-3-methyladenine glycosylase I [Caviibacter abscessus]